MATETSHDERLKGLSSEDYCYLKCWVALVKIGKKVLLNVLNWGYCNVSSHSFREGLRLLPGYSNSKYKIDFNKDERQRIENDTSDKYDITLLYTLIQRLCKLVPASEQITVNSASTKKISKLLLDVKNTRNKFAHPLLGLNETEMINCISEMKQLFDELLSEALVEFSVDHHEVTNLKNEVNQQLREIVQSPLPASNITEHLVQVAREKASLAVKEGLKDLKLAYESLAEISVTPWPFAPWRRPLNEVFVKGKLMYCSSFIMRNRLSEHESEFDVDDIITITDINSQDPSFILITGQAGSGKSILLKYILQSWLKANASLKNIENYDFVIYIDCRDTISESLKDVFAQLMPNTSTIFSEEELKRIVSLHKCLFLIDNVDELNKYSENVINEILSSSNSNKIIVTATLDLSNQILQKAHHRKSVKLKLKSLWKENIHDYICMMHNSLPSVLQHGNLEIFLSEMLTNNPLAQDWLHNPEILSHVFFNWCFASNERSRCASLTHILLQSFNLILKKLEEKVTNRSMSGICEMHSLNIKLQNFLIELGGIALLNLKNHTTGLGFKNVSHLILTCQQLNLPANVVLSEFLCFREVLNENILQNSAKVTFPSISFQEFSCAYYIYRLIIGENSNVDLDDLLDLKPADVSRCRVKNILKYLIGLLSTSHETILDKYSNKIIDILQNSCFVQKSVHWFQFLEEAQGHNKFTDRVLNLLQGDWQVEDTAISSNFVNLLSKFTPKLLQVVCTEDPKVLVHLNEVLEFIKTCNSSIKLSLLLYSQFWKLDCGYSDHFLQILSANPMLVRIDKFAGRLSNKFFKLIPRTVTRLAIQIELCDVSYLNNILLKLDNLQILSLNVNIPADGVYLPEIPQLTVAKNVTVSFDIFGCTTENLRHNALLIGRVIKNLDRLAIRKTKLDYQSALDFINALNSEQLSISSIIIGSCISLPSHQRLRLTSQADTLLHCQKLEWMTL